MYIQLHVMHVVPNLIGGYTPVYPTIFLSNVRELKTLAASYSLYTIFWLSFDPRVVDIGKSLGNTQEKDA